jgi:hypothetical protein
MVIKKKIDPQEFPYEQFPFKLIHKEGKDLKDTKTCYFQFQEHADKYIERSKFKLKDYQLFIKPGTNVETVGKSTRRKSTQKRSSSRQSSSN